MKMRVLNAKQKKLIDQWFNQHWAGQGSIYSNEQMPAELCDRLVEINDHETIWQNIDRYINDKACEKLYRRNK